MIVSVRSCVAIHLKWPKPILLSGNSLIKTGVKKTLIKTAVLLNTLCRISVTNNRAVCLHTYFSKDIYKMVFTF